MHFDKSIFDYQNRLTGTLYRGFDTLGFDTLTGTIP